MTSVSVTNNGCELEQDTVKLDNQYVELRLTQYQVIKKRKRAGFLKT